MIKQVKSKTNLKAQNAGRKISAKKEEECKQIPHELCSIISSKFMHPKSPIVGYAPSG